VAIIDHGRIVATGTPQELMARSTAVQSVSIATAQPIGRGELERLPGVQDVTQDGTRAQFTTTNVTRTIAGLMQSLEATRIELVELHVRKASLEDVFIELTGAALRD
jgi:ABC-2 type transport system ATP-binding protein